MNPEKPKTVVEKSGRSLVVDDTHAVAVMLHVSQVTREAGT